MSASTVIVAINAHCCDELGCSASGRNADDARYRFDIAADSLGERAGLGTESSSTTTRPRNDTSVSVAKTSRTLTVLAKLHELITARRRQCAHILQMKEEQAVAISPNGIDRIAAALPVVCNVEQQPHVTRVRRVHDPFELARSLRE